MYKKLPKSFEEFQGFLPIPTRRMCNTYYWTPVLGVGLEVDFTFAWDKKNNDNDNSRLNFVKGTVLGEKERGVGIMDSNG